MRSRDAYRYVCKRQRDLCLEEWALEVETVQANCIDETRVGRAYDFGPDTPFARLKIACRDTDEEVRTTCTHEVLHVRLADMGFALERALARLGEAEAQAIRGEYSQAEERAVAAITQALEEQED